MTDTFAEKVEEFVKQSSEDIEVEGEEVDEVSESLDHRCRKPNAHVFVRTESGDVGTRAEDGKDGEENLLAHGVPEFGREGLTMFLQSFEEVIERSIKMEFKFSYVPLNG